MTGTKLARIRCCQKPCQYWRSQPGLTAFPVCAADDTELTDAQMETGRCSKGYWDGLVPVDMEALAAEEAAKAKAAAEADATRADLLIKDLGIPNTESVRLAFVTREFLKPEAAVELKAKAIAEAEIK